MILNYCTVYLFVMNIKKHWKIFEFFFENLRTFSKIFKTLRAVMFGSFWIRRPTRAHSAVAFAHVASTRHALCFAGVIDSALLTVGTTCCYSLGCITCCLHTKLMRSLSAPNVYL